MYKNGELGGEVMPEDANPKLLNLFFCSATLYFVRAKLTSSKDLVKTILGLLLLIPMFVNLLMN